MYSCVHNCTKFSIRARTTRSTISYIECTSTAVLESGTKFSRVYDILNLVLNLVCISQQCTKFSTTNTTLHTAVVYFQQLKHESTRRHNLLIDGGRAWIPHTDVYKNSYKFKNNQIQENINVANCIVPVSVPWFLVLSKKR